MNDVQRNCHFCGHRCESWCPVCVLAFERRRQVDEMSIEERVAELRQWGGPLEIPFSSVHQRIEELMMRAVYTHEMGNFDALASEIRARVPANLADIIAKVPPEKLITLGLEGSGPVS